MAAIERINYPALGEVKAPYVHAVKQGNRLYISGLTAFGSTAQTGSIAEQAEVILNSSSISLRQKTPRSVRC